jgi:hypothetical protein
MSSERDVVEELWGMNRLLTLRAFLGRHGPGFIRGLRRAMVLGRRGSTEGPLPLPEGIDENEILEIVRACFAAEKQLADAMRRLHAQTEKLGHAHDEHLALLDHVRRQFEAEIAQAELLTLALEFELATEADKQRFVRAREAIERRLATYLVDGGEGATWFDDLLARLVGKRRLARSRRTNDAMMIVEAIRHALVLERAIGAGISIEEADAQDRARWE